MQMNTIEAYYDSNAQLEWDRFNRHRLEFAITKRALLQYLPPPPASILDCGGGPGRYAIYLSQLGYQVSLLDLSQGNLNFAKVKAKEANLEISKYIHGNAVDLSQFMDGEFDAVLLLGPLYHLVHLQDRNKAMQEALRVLRQGSPLFAGFITWYAPFRDAIAKGYLQNIVEYREIARALLMNQVVNPGFTDAWFAKPSEILPWMESFQLKTLAMLASEGLAAGHEQHINVIDEEDFEYWVDINYQMCSDPHLYGAADHLLYIGKREAE